MRYLISLPITLLLIQPCAAIDFNACVDTTGMVHYTNLPLSELDENCQQKQHYYQRRLESDHIRLRNSLDESLLDELRGEPDESEKLDSTDNNVQSDQT
ncbi:MAG: hypothetical protein RLT87_05730 [Gammaproteobacteria bacterium]